MNWGLIIVIAIVVIAVLFVIGLYNGLVQKRLRIDEAFAQIEVQLKRRHDLIPNLVNAVKGYMGFEQKVLTDVTNARAAAVAAGGQGPTQQAAAENVLTSTLRSLFAVVENYPQLKANENVLSLQEQLTTTENQISFSRQHYNATVLDYNQSIATFPNVQIAGPFGFGRREFFAAEPEAAEVPVVALRQRVHLGGVVGLGGPRAARGVIGGDHLLQPDRGESPQRVPACARPDAAVRRAGL